MDKVAIISKGMDTAEKVVGDITKSLGDWDMQKMNVKFRKSGKIKKVKRKKKKIRRRWFYFNNIFLIIYLVMSLNF